jgi:uncharacterized RDD family membrane protein YckC
VSTLVTGDAVVLELPPAGLATRLVAIVLDVLVYWGLLFVAAFVFAPLLGVDPALGAAVTLTLFVTCLVVVPTVIEASTRGRSLGKLALGLRVVRDDGGSIRTRHAFIRQLVAVPEIYLTFGVVTVFAVLWNSRAKRFGDMLAGTYVVSERTPLLGSPMAEMPPHLAGWAATADLGRIPGPLALAGRTYLARSATMTPAARAESGGGIAAELALYVSPLPPEGTHPDAFVAAVLAERRRRDLHRLAAERAKLDRLRELTARRRERV